MKPTVFVLASLVALSASAKWDYSQGGAPSGGGTHLLTDGNWQIGIEQMTGQMTGGWLLKKYKAGSGVLDLRMVESDCGVKIVQLHNGAMENVSGLTDVYLPNSVINLDGATFKNCSALTQVVLNEGLKAIGSANNNTFLDCKKLTTINFPSTLEKIGKNAFQNCVELELTDFVLPVSVTTIDDHAFAGCTKITGSFTGPGVTTFAGEYHFEGANLTNVTFMYATTIPTGLCYKMKTLLSANFGSGITSIGYRAFGDCSALETVTYGGPVESIGGQAFSGCSAYVLGEHTFPVELKTIGDHAFAGCTKVTGPLTFPGLETVTGTYTFEKTEILSFTAPNCTTIVQGMFKECKKIQTVEFSPNVTQFGTDVFRNGGSSLVSFCPMSFPLLSGSFGSEVFHGQKNLSIPVFDLSESAITELGGYAFADCHNVGTVKLPATLTTLGAGSLGYNDGRLRAVWFYGPPPTTIGGKALMPKERDTSKYWVLVAAKGHATDWEAKVGESITANDTIVPLGDGEDAAAKAAAATLGLTGVKPIGKWMHVDSGYTYWHWVVEELPKGLAIYIM